MLRAAVAGFLRDDGTAVCKRREISVDLTRLQDPLLDLQYPMDGFLNRDLTNNFTKKNMVDWYEWFTI